MSEQNLKNHTLPLIHFCSHPPALISGTIRYGRKWVPNTPSGFRSGQIKVPSTSGLRTSFHTVPCTPSSLPAQGARQTQRGAWASCSINFCCRATEINKCKNLFSQKPYIRLVKQNHALKGIITEMVRQYRGQRRARKKSHRRDGLQPSFREDILQHWNTHQEAQVLESRDLHVPVTLKDNCQAFCASFLDAVN